MEAFTGEQNVLIMTRLHKGAIFLLPALAATYVAACGVLSRINRAHVLSSAGSASANSAHPDRLPPGFLLGTATSAYQVEGGNQNADWAAFEQLPGTIARGERAGRAADEWNRVPQDIGLMRAMGANAYRFSIEWSRLEPKRGAWDEVAWSHYVDEVSQLRAAGVEPMVTLLHFTLPQWLAEQGGLRAPDFPALFARFAAEAARRLGAQVHLWCTINEPNTQMALGYLDGRWPPGEQSPQNAKQALVGLLRAHAGAARELHEHAPGAQVGVAVNLIIADPSSRWNLLDWVTAYVSRSAYDWCFYDAIRSGRARLWVPGFLNLDERIDGLKGSADFYGVNYYTRFLFHFSPSTPEKFTQRPGPGTITDMGWEIYPDGMLRILRAVWSRYRLPVYVTENGIADSTGRLRGPFVEGHLRAVWQALGEGIPVRGYFYWSLMDNFEWAEGFRPRFGLYHVDYATEERSPAAGSDVFRIWAQKLRR
jgi:beta-glucosidase